MSLILKSYTGESFEVNPVDLIAIEVLRVFVPAVYDRLPEMRHILTVEPRFMRKEEREQDAAALSSPTSNSTLIWRH